MTALPIRHPFTINEYHRMRDARVFAEDDRIELLDGEIIKMAPIGPRHAACVKRLSEYLGEKVRKLAIVGVQDPILLSEFSEPQPDISLLKRRADFYAAAHPTPADILVAIEVADTTAENDRQVKVPSYARAEIQEVWLIDLPSDRIEIYTNPNSGIYQEVRIVLRGQKIISPAFPNLKLKADAILS